MKPWSWLNYRLAYWHQWELNPVVVKELRQAVRNWSVTGMLLLFLVILFGTSLVYLVSQSFTANADRQLGARVFQAFLVVLTAASTIFIPLYVGIRLAIERQENNVDLLYISTLSPGRIIRGKLYCGSYMTLLFFSACMPFMALTNLLRGIDLPTVFFTLIVLFLLVCAAVQVAILLACLPISRPLKVLIALFGIWMGFMLLGGMLTMSSEFLRLGVGAMMSSSGFWVTCLTSLGIGLGAFLLLHLLSIALISPVSANRALPLRSYVTAIWLLGGGLSLYWIKHERDTRLLIPWAIIMGLLLAASLLIVISGHDQLSLRVRRRIPHSGWKRAIAFLFYNGAAGGLLWVTLLALLTLGVAYTVFSWGLDNSHGYTSVSLDDMRSSLTIAAAVGIYVLAYGLTALWIHRRWFARRPPRLAGAIALIIPGLLAVGPNIVLFLVNRLSWSTVERLQPGNLFNLLLVTSHDDRQTHLAFAIGWLIVALALNVPWFLQQLRAFQPLQPAPPLIANTSAT